MQPHYYSDVEGDMIKLNRWLAPASWLYGLAVGLRNTCFDLGVLSSQAYDVPVIAVGNITVGGSGKTPHVEYLVRLLRERAKVAVLSRGYRRKSKGYVLATPDMPMSMIGDEPYQMRQKFADIHIAVDTSRRHGIERLTTDEATKDTEVVLLDDAYQHRYVKPGINILLVDYHRLIIYDRLLPVGRLREPKEGKARADIVIVTKCPEGLTPMDYRVLTKAMNLRPYQKLYFSALQYGDLQPLFDGQPRTLSSLTPHHHVLLLTGIASPAQMRLDLLPYTEHITPMTFADHHPFTPKDIARLNTTFAAMPQPKVIITTEKDKARLVGLTGMSHEVRQSIFALPLTIHFLLNQGDDFNDKIIGYVRKNSRDSILAKAKDDHKAQGGNNTGHRSRTISFRNH